MTPDEQRREYERLMGKQARERQERLATERCLKCGTVRPNHSPLCPDAPR